MRLTCCFPYLCDDPQQLARALPSLQALLSRGQRLTTPALSHAQRLFALFNFPEQNPLPLAALTGLAHGLDTREGFWLRADPVHLQADLHTVYCFGQQDLTISLDEKNQLIDELNTLLAQEGFSLHAATAKAWYINTTDDPHLQSEPLNHVLGRALTHYMPQGDARWRRLLTEVQMLLHASVVNQQRSAAGQLPINGLWFWGAGALPHAQQMAWQQVISDDPLTQGLAVLHDVILMPDIQSLSLWLRQAKQQVLLSLTAPGYYPGCTHFDREAYYKYLQQNCFEPICQALKRGVLQELELHFPQASYVVSRRQARKWWRKTCTWDELLCR